MTEAEPIRACQWCGAEAPAPAVECPACGAALAERESLGGLVLPGVTAVHPALEAYDAQPWRIPKASPSQGLAPGTIAAAAMGGPVGLAALGGLAAVAAVEYLTAGPDLESGAPPGAELGQPSEAALLMLEKLRTEEGAEGAPGDASAEAEGPEVSRPEVSRPPGP